MTDPNNWVKNPPSTFVRVHGTSRETLNGQLGIVLQYLDDKARYMVLLCENQQSPVALKPENLAVCSGLLDKGKGYYQMFKHNPQVRQQFQQVQNQIKARTGLEAHYVLALVLVLFTVGCYGIGFSKTMMLLTTLIVILTILGPDLAAGKDLRTCLRNAPVRWRAVVQEQVPVVGPKIAANPWYLRAFTALMVLFVLYSLIATPKKGRPLSSSSSTPRTNSRGLLANTVATSELKQKYYKLGFDDATSGLEFGASLPKADAEEGPDTLTGSIIDDNDGSSNAARGVGYSSWRQEEDFTTAFDPTPVKKKSPLSLSTAFAAFTVYRILSPLAMNADGKLDLPLLRANLTNLEVYKLGILAFSVYRLVTAFL